jgi:bis(5'-nucleosyl)-tetraphosphatase (symmetrical)
MGRASTMSWRFACLSPRILPQWRIEGGWSIFKGYAMAIYAMGDVQGCYKEFRSLLKEIAFDPKKDKLWVAGDLVNRGPASLEVLRWVFDNQTAVRCVLGNHDLHLLAVADGVAATGKRDTLDAILEAHDQDKLLGWLRKRPFVHREDGFLMVHAGLLPGWTPDDAQRHSAELSQVLQGPGSRAFLRDMRGAEPDRWSEELTGIDRYRVIVSAFTRLRLCTPEGVMEFKHSGTPEEAPPGYLPWFEVPGRQSTEVSVISGHWAALGLRIRPNLLAIDTGCVWGKSLTAVRLEDRRVFQVHCKYEAGPTGD